MNQNPTDAIVAAYEALPPDEKTRIDRLSEQLINGVRMRAPGRLPYFGKVCALELLAKLGQFLVKECG
jgi:hypothetical protein